jgi:hypothetical protein
VEGSLWTSRTINFDFFRRVNARDGCLLTIVRLILQPENFNVNIITRAWTFFQLLLEWQFYSSWELDTSLLGHCFKLLSFRIEHD